MMFGVRFLVSKETVQRLMALLAVLACFGLAEPSIAAERTRTVLSGEWRFIGKDVPGAGAADVDDWDWRRVTLPHTYNVADGDDGGTYYRGPGWYRTTLDLSEKKAKRLYFLEFEGAALAADVWVNGVLVGRHEGGYARFRFDVTQVIATGRNQIAVRTDNTRLANIAPLGGDFTVFGGLFRPVSLIETDSLHFDMMHFGGPGIHVSVPRATQESGTVSARMRLVNGGGLAASTRYRVSLLDARGREVAKEEGKRRINPEDTTEAEVTLNVAKPHLWNGTADPYLYRLVATIHDEDGKLRDRVELPVGIRSIEITPDRGLLLNGRPYQVRGVNYFHSQRPGKGTAVSDEDISRDMAIIAEMGATGVRFVHYQHPQRAYDEADRRGLLVWTEVPLNSAIDPGEAFAENIRQQTRELIAQNAHHPSVVVWGLGNEVYEDSDNAVRMIAVAQEAARAADPTRPTTYAHCCQADNSPKALVPDLSAFNRYFGWYPDQKGSLGEWAQRFHASFPDRPFAIGEYGAGGGILAQESDPEPPITTSRWHPEQYQTAYHERNWREIRDLPYLWGSFIWVAFDLASDGRNEGDRPGINDKGLISFDRSVRKDAYFWYQANWSSKPMLHLTERRHNFRHASQVTVRAYSNQSRVGLKVNERSYPEVPVVDHVARWDQVDLGPGENRIEVTSGELRDEAIWTRLEGGAEEGSKEKTPSH
ncbi:glycoside hydrolase family 2 protein [Altererythrobacter sp.]|uniref:glycoside hydrolase family 2 protein n=1 Tax=Altererythrobacter sp. TaxID=1872480 RepID=UPI003D10AB4E